MLSHDIAAVLGDDELDHWPGHAVKLYSFEQKIRDKDTANIAIQARKLGIGKPIELLVQGCSLVIVDASPEPSRNSYTQAPVPAVPGRCTPDDERAWR
jgi:hypothetical protein